MASPTRTPIFGDNTDLNARQPFRIVALYSPDDGAEPSRHVWDFTGYKDPGSGPIFRFSAAGAGESAQVQAASALIIATLVRDDAPPVDVEILDDNDEPAYPSEVAQVEPDSPADLGQMSSYHRLLRLMNSRDWRVASSVLVEMAEWIAKNSGLDSAERPTQPAPR